MCELCAESDSGVEHCQDCGNLICFDDNTAYVTTSGDLFCVRCGREIDEEEERMADEEWGWYSCDPFDEITWLDAEQEGSEA